VACNAAKALEIARLQLLQTGAASPSLDLQVNDNQDFDGAFNNDAGSNRASKQVENFR
jgi:hypothetical protein